MSLFRTDPLLAFCRLLCWLILIGAAAACAFGVAVSILMVFDSDAVVRVVRTGYPQLRDVGLRMPMHLAMGFVALAFALVIRFMLYLLSVIGAVVRSEPFTLANAALIRGMAWLSLAGIPVGVCLAGTLSGVVARLGPRAPEAGIRIEAYPHGTVSGQILVTLLLFVLARLFAQAAAMRDEIEGTV